MPRPANRSVDLADRRAPVAPVATQAIEQRLARSAASRSRDDSACAGTSPGKPMNGRAMTRPTPMPSTTSVVGRLAPARTSCGTTDTMPSCAGDLKHAVGRGVDDRASRSPCARRRSSSMTAVPDATTLPIDLAADARLELLDHIRREAVREGRERRDRAPRPSAPSGRSPSPCPAIASPCGRRRPSATAAPADRCSATEARHAERRRASAAAADMAARCCRACCCPASSYGGGVAAARRCRRCRAR